MDKKCIRFTVLTSLMVALFGGHVYALPDLNYRWLHSTVGARNFAPAYAPYFTPAAANVMLHTNLTLGNSANQTKLPPYSGDVAFEEINMGPNGFAGASVAYNVHGLPCSDPVNLTLTGNCTMSVGADHGHVRFNTYYIPIPTSAQAQHLLIHEFIHILGFGHGGCYPSTGVMAPSIVCEPLFTTIQPAEAAILNINY